MRPIRRFQDERLAVELQLRTSIEPAIHRDYYRNHPVLRGAKIQFNFKKGGIGFLPLESLFDLTCFNFESERVLSEKGFESAFFNEMMVTSVNYTYSGTLQIMGLASVVGFSLEPLYPEQRTKLLPIYQVLRIMWTNTRGWPDRSKEFKVNPFVPLLRKNPHEGRPDADWKSVAPKRKCTGNQWNREKVLKQQGNSAFHSTKNPNQ